MKDQKNVLNSFLVEQILLDTAGNDPKIILAFNKGSLIHLSLS